MIRCEKRSCEHNYPDPRDRTRGVCVTEPHLVPYKPVIEKPLLLMCLTYKLKECIKQEEQA